MEAKIFKFYDTLIGRVFGNFTFQCTDDMGGYYALCREDLNIGVNICDDSKENFAIEMFDNETEHQFEERYTNYKYPTTKEEFETFKVFYLETLHKLADELN